MISLSRIAFSSIRFTTRVWPFAFGKDFATRVGAFATRIGVLGSAWYEVRPGLWMRLNARDLIPQTILLEGMWDPILTDLVERSLCPGDVFIDVGAHVGYFTLLAARRVGAAGTVLSIEPNPFALKHLRENVERNRIENVWIEDVACGDARDVTRLYVHTESNTSMASLSGANVAGRRSVAVSRTTLDRLCEDRGVTRATLVKIDVEGAELSVLRGMSRILSEMQPVIVLELEPRLLRAFETSRDAVATLLQGFGYTLSPLGGHANYVCRPSGHGA
jgi:FkbM family methyltransferase